MSKFVERLSRKIILWLYGKRVVYRLPYMEQVAVEKDLVYKREGAQEWRFNLYRPPVRAIVASTPQPAVVLVHGNGPEHVLRYAKDWGTQESWGQLLAASGLNAITFNHRSLEGFTRLAEAGQDVADMLDHLRREAPALGLLPDRLALFGFSAGVPLALKMVLDQQATAIRCGVAYYGALDLQHLRGYLSQAVSDLTLQEYSAINHLQRRATRPPPLLVVKAGFDGLTLNDSIERFVDKARFYEAPVRFINYPEGHHGFDVLDNTDRSREIIRATLEFLKQHLNPAAHLLLP